MQKAYGYSVVGCRQHFLYNVSKKRYDEINFIKARGPYEPYG
jgi:hypothetical protein